MNKNQKEWASCPLPMGTATEHKVDRKSVTVCPNTFYYQLSKTMSQRDCSEPHKASTKSKQVYSKRAQEPLLTPNTEVSAHATSAQIYV